MCLWKANSKNELEFEGQIQRCEEKGEDKMVKVGIVMGSDSDLPVMEKAADVLKQLGIGFEMRIISAHREPEVFLSMPNRLKKEG